MRESVESIARLGPYELGSVLGSGAFATVRAAVHLPTNEKVGMCRCLPTDPVICHDDFVNNRLLSNLSSRTL